MFLPGDETGDCFKFTQSLAGMSRDAGVKFDYSTNETHKVAVTRLGERIRAGGTAERAGYSARRREARRDTLEHVVRDPFSGGGDVARWTGLRPMTPDGAPVVGRTRYANLYLATGHGTLGWTMAAGTGRLMADVIGGHRPEIDLDGLMLARYGQQIAA